MTPAAQPSRRTAFAAIVVIVGFIGGAMLWVHGNGVANRDQMRKRAELIRQTLNQGMSIEESDAWVQEQYNAYTPAGRPWKIAAWVFISTGCAVGALMLRRQRAPRGPKVTAVAQV